MSSLVLTGDTSGQVTIAAPAVAGTNTATLPAATGELSMLGTSGQTWQVVTRTSGTTYTNSTGKPIMVSVRISSNVGVRGQTDITINSGTAITIADSYGGASAGGYGGGSIIVPVGATYVLTDTTVLSRTTNELR